jgi:radical SAM superfamily enzyme YgiQ (UPF0313 family)
MGRKYRVRSVNNLLDELEWIEENLKVKEVFFEDDTFTINKKRDRLLQKIQREGSRHKLEL